MFDIRSLSKLYGGSTGVSDPGRWRVCVQDRADAVIEGEMAVAEGILWIRRTHNGKLVGLVGFPLHSVRRFEPVSQDEDS